MGFSPNSPNANDDALPARIVEPVVVVVENEDRITNAIYALPAQRPPIPVGPPQAVRDAVVDDARPVPTRRDAMNAFVRQNWLVILTAAIAIGGYLATLRTVSIEIESIKSAMSEQNKEIAALKVEQARQTEATSDIKEIRATAEETARNVAALCQATGANCR